MLCSAACCKAAADRNPSRRRRRSSIVANRIAQWFWQEGREGRSEILCSNYLAFETASWILRPGAENPATSRQPVRHEVVTHVLGTTLRYAPLPLSPGWTSEVWR